MVGKAERVKKAMKNIEAALNFILKQTEKSLKSNKISKKRHEELLKDPKRLLDIISLLKFEDTFKDETQDEIRTLNYTVKSLYFGDDFNLVNNHFNVTNAILNRDIKLKDRKLLDEFKKIYNSLPNDDYRTVIRGVEINNDGQMVCNNNPKKQNNFSVLVAHYLDAKYNLKKLKYKETPIGEEYQALIDKYTLLIKDASDEDKQKFSEIIKCIEGYARSELVINALKEMYNKCNREPFDRLKDTLEGLLDKYISIREESITKLSILSPELILPKKEEKHKGLDK